MDKPAWIAQRDQVIQQQREAFKAAGLLPTEIERAMEPTLSFYAQLDEEEKGQLHS